MKRAYDEDEIEALLGAYALDAVDPDEREAVELHLPQCPRCRAELREHLEVAAMLAEGAPAPDGLWARIADSLEEPPPALRLAVQPRSVAASVVEPAPEAAAPVVPITAAPSSRPKRSAVALVGVAAAVIAVLGIVVVRQESRIDRMDEEVALPSLDAAAGEAMADPSSTKTVLADPAGGELSATAVVTADGTGYLVTPNLPTLADDRTYQLWGIVGEQVISLGVLGTEPSVSVFQVDAKVPVDGFAVTEEVSGGVVSSANDPTLVGTRA
jgi:anti-sigma factor RsiW